MVTLPRNGGKDVLRVGPLEIRPDEYTVLLDGRHVPLTVREFQLFLALAERFDRVVTREQLYKIVWHGQMPYRDRSVDVFIRKVRRKFAELQPGMTFIHTHFGVGYRLSPEPTVLLTADDQI